MGPYLPPELWLDIFSFAIHVPALFDTTWNYTPDELIWEGVWAKKNPTRMGDESLKLRKALVQVSRTWQSIGMRFLYEELIVNRRETVANLVTLFEQSGNCAPVEARNGGNGSYEAGYGRWVRRVSIDGDRWFKVDVFPNLELLLKHCPNVQTILLNVVLRDSSYLPHLSRFFRSLKAHSLRRISFIGLPHKAGLVHLFQPSNTPVSLDWAALPSHWILKLFPNTSSSRPPASLSNLSILEVANHVEVTEFPSWDLPSLRYLSIRRLKDAEIPSFIPFMATNGHRLLGLRLWTSERCLDLEKFIEYTTALQSLVFDDLDLVTLRPPDTVSYSSITHIGLTHTSYHSSSDTSRIRNGLDYILGRNLFPSLRTVRILTHDIPLQLDDDWEHPIATAAQYGIRLEDLNRRLLRY